VTNANALSRLLQIARRARDKVHLGEPLSYRWQEVERVWIGEDAARLYARWDSWTRIPTGYVLAVGPPFTPPEEEARVRAHIGTAVLDPATSASDAGDKWPDRWRLLLDLYVPWLPEGRERPHNEPTSKEFWAAFGKVETVQDLQRLRGVLNLAAPSEAKDRRSRRLERQREQASRRRGHDSRPRTLVPLVDDDAELFASISLRCAQQGYRGADALKQLRSYAEDGGVARNLVDDVVSEALEKIVDLAPFGLHAYVKRLAHAKQAALKQRELLDATEPELSRQWQESEPTGFLEKEVAFKGRLLSRDAAPSGFGDPRRETLGVDDVAIRLAVRTHTKFEAARRTVYRRVKNKKLKAIRTQPLRFDAAEVDQFLSEELRSPRMLHKLVAVLRDTSAPAARMWVSRRRAQGHSDEDILQEARAGFPERIEHLANARTDAKGTSLRSQVADPFAAFSCLEEGTEEWERLVRQLGWDPFKELGV
jgi:hypothetical protein